MPTANLSSHLPRSASSHTPSSDAPSVPRADPHPLPRLRWPHGKLNAFDVQATLTLALDNAYGTKLTARSRARIVERLSEAVKPDGQPVISSKAWPPIAKAAYEMAKAQVARERKAVATYPFEKVSPDERRVTAQDFFHAMNVDRFRPMTFSQAELLWELLVERLSIPAAGISKNDWPSFAADYALVRDYVQTRVRGPTALDFDVIRRLKPRPDETLSLDVDTSVLLEGCPIYPPEVPRGLAQALAGVTQEMSTFQSAPEARACDRGPPP